jgi:hypothetical protein
VFQPGNKYGKGRPKLSAIQADLPAFFASTRINWVGDFAKLYNLLKERQLTDLERAQLKFFLEIMPYLCPKERFATPKKDKPQPPSQDDRKTSLLLRALEQENAPRSTSQG